MTQISAESMAVVQPELVHGESILWAGQPSTKIIFHKEDLFLVPFSLLWGGFALFWEAGVAGFWDASTGSGKPWVFGMIWGIPFVVIGQYLIWGRFFYVSWKKNPLCDYHTTRSRGSKRLEAPDGVRISGSPPCRVEARKWGRHRNSEFCISGTHLAARCRWMGNLGCYEHRNNTDVRRCA